MKIRRPILFITLGLLLLSFGPLVRGQNPSPEETVSKIRAIVLDPNFKPDGIDKILIEALDASLAILPDKEYAAEYKSKIDWVKNSLAEKELFSDKIGRYLGLAYKLVANGTAWQLPEELKSPYAGEKAAIEQATKVCGRFLESALAEIKTGNNEKAVRHLLDFVILVVTPIKA